MNPDQLADPASRRRSGIRCRLDRGDVTTDDCRDQAGIDLLPTYEHDVRSLDHRVRSLNHPDKTARLKVAPTDTTFSVGKKMNGVDQKWLNTFGAEQKVMGPLTVKGAVNETPTGAYDRSISAGFKATW